VFFRSLVSVALVLRPTVFACVTSAPLMSTKLSDGDVCSASCLLALVTQHAIVTVSFKYSVMFAVSFFSEGKHFD